MEKCEVLDATRLLMPRATETTGDSFLSGWCITAEHSLCSSPYQVIVSLWWWVFNKPSEQRTLLCFVTKKNLHTFSSSNAVKRNKTWHNLAKKWLKKHQNVLNWNQMTNAEPTANICKLNKCEPVLLIGEGCHGNTLVLEARCKTVPLALPLTFSEADRNTWLFSLSKVMFFNMKRLKKKYPQNSCKMHLVFVPQCPWITGLAPDTPLPVWGGSASETSVRCKVAGVGEQHGRDSDITLSHVWAFDLTTLREGVWK